LARYSQISTQSCAPDCPVVHRTVSVAPGKSPMKRPLSGKVQRRMAIIHWTVRWCTGLSGEPMIASATVGRAIRGRRVARTNGRQGAPDCPVRHLTEDKDGLSCWPPTAPSYLGAIKGTPRRMEERHKHSLSILRHPDSVPAHSFHCVSDLSSTRVEDSLCCHLSSSLLLCAWVCCDLCLVCVCCSSQPYSMLSL
jgi:hypothetical protein